jgi:hypothetical protein
MGQAVVLQEVYLRMFSRIKLFCIADQIPGRLDLDRDAIDMVGVF